MSSLTSIVQADLFRIVGSKKTWLGIIKNLYKPEFCYMFFLRCTRFHYTNKNKIRFLFSNFLLRHYSIKFGYEIPYQCDIKLGLRLVHRGGVIVNPLAKIGSNVTLLRGCTIGSNRRGKNCGAPVIGDNVWVGANTAIIGGITIGNDVMIAPNAYINFDVPAHSICIGNPAIIIHKLNATDSYIDNPI